MAHDRDTRRHARRLYVHDRKPLPMIAIELSIPERTIRRWKADSAEQGDAWDEARAAHTIAGEGLTSLVTEVVEGYVVMHRSALEDLRNQAGITPGEKAKILASLADSFNKVVNAAGRVAPKISELGVALDVLQQLADYVMRHHSDAAPTLLEVLEPFGEQLAKGLK